MPVDVEHAHVLACGVTSSVIKKKVRKWAGKQEEAKRQKKHCAESSSTEGTASSAENTPDTNFAGATATIYPEWGYKDKAENEGERGENDYSD